MEKTRTKICLTLSENTLEGILQKASPCHADFDLVEIRGDFLNPEERQNLAKLPSLLGVDAILTLRLPPDGGQWKESEELRRQTLLKALDGEWYAVDLESWNWPQEAAAKAKSKGIRVIESFHDFQGLGENILDFFHTTAQKGHIPKAAVTPNNISELAKLLSLMDQIKHLEEKVLLGMGPYGSPTRILGGRYGISWSYGSLPGHEVAPGHFNVKDMRRLYVVDQLSPETALYGIIGNPVHHTKSPQIHNKGFRFLELDAVYLPFQVDDFDAFWESADFLNIKGLSVTIPWKNAAYQWVGENATEAMKAVGACNTLVKKDKSWFGTNTDAPGFFAPLVDHFGEDGLEGAKISIIGNGGAAKAALFTLKQAKADILLLGRNPEKIATLAEEFSVKWAKLEPESAELVKEHRQLIIQTTPVGMGERAGENPLSFYQFQGDEVAYDMIYVPQFTAFLEEARAAGALCIFGSQMLLGQAYLQFKLFTEQDYPQELQ